MKKTIMPFELEDSLIRVTFDQGWPILAGDSGHVLVEEEHHRALTLSSLHCVALDMRKTSTH